MNNLLIRSVIIGITLFFNSCIGGPEDELAIYFELKPLLSAQVNLLTELQPSVTKRVSLDEQVEQSESILDSTQWANELEIFFESDINKPSLVGAFDEAVSDNKISYTLKDQSQDGVKAFEVSFMVGSKTPREITIESSSHNSLYTSSRALQLVFANRNDVPVLTSYSISGDQSILFGETTTYMLEANLKF